ncbi:MAG: hypothetical protein M3Y08_06010 [Fibrobacterota bacterium]|nr:hypothetical protein [Fibrobacterota bacterium]
MEVAKELFTKAAKIDPAIPLFYRKLDEDFGHPGLFAETMRCFRTVLESQVPDMSDRKLEGKIP